MSTGYDHVLVNCNVCQYYEVCSRDFLLSHHLDGDLRLLFGLQVHFLATLINGTRTVNIVTRHILYLGCS